MGAIKKKSIAALTEGLDKFEYNKKNVDLSGVKDISDLMNMMIGTSDRKKRRKLLEEFKSRKLELYEFLKANPELLSAEAEIAQLIGKTAAGEETTAEAEISSLYKALEASNDI